MDLPIVRHAPSEIVCPRSTERSCNDLPVVRYCDSVRNGNRSPIGLGTHDALMIVRYFSDARLRHNSYVGRPNKSHHHLKSTQTQRPLCHWKKIAQYAYMNQTTRRTSTGRWLCSRLHRRRLLIRRPSYSRNRPPILQEMLDPIEQAGG